MFTLFYTVVISQPGDSLIAYPTCHLADNCKTAQNERARWPVVAQLVCHSGSRLKSVVNTLRLVIFVSGEELV